MIVLGVVLLSIIVPLMIVNWADLIFEKGFSEELVLGVLITANLSGLLSTIGLLLHNACVKVKDNIKTGAAGTAENKRANQIYRKKQKFLKIKLYSLYLFGFGYAFHCGLYAWKHHDTANGLGLAHNVITIFYIFLLLLYLSRQQDKYTKDLCCKQFSKLLILLSSVCIWLDTLFSESGYLFQQNEGCDNTTTGQNVTGLKEGTIKQYNTSTRAEETIEKTDPFLSPAMVEFALMTIDLLFTKNGNFIKEDDAHSKIGTPVEGMESEEKDKSRKIDEDKHSTKNDAVYIKGKMFCLRIMQLFFSFACFALFAFTLTVLLTHAQSTDFLVYIVFQLIFKSFILFLIIVCIVRISSFWELKFHLNVEAFVFIFSCFGNIVYHTFYCLAFFSDKWEKSVKYECTFFVHTSLWISLSENIISICIAGLQTYFILGMHSSKNISLRDNTLQDPVQNKSSQSISNSDKNCCKEFFWGFRENTVYCICCILGIINWGLWFCDSIGEGRIGIFSINLNKAYDEKVWMVLNKLILPLTIFFRFNTGLEFFKLYIERNDLYINEKQIEESKTKDQTEVKSV